MRRLGRALRAGPPTAGRWRPPAVIDADLGRTPRRRSPGRAARCPHRAGAARSRRRWWRCAAGAQAGQSAHDLLWAVWSGSEWEDRLTADAEGSGPESAEANRTLDAVVVLFDLAGRSHERSPGETSRSFIAEVDAQEIPAAPLADAGVGRAGRAGDDRAPQQGPGVGRRRRRRGAGRRLAGPPASRVRCSSLTSWVLKACANR